MSTDFHTPTAANGGEMLPTDVTVPDASLDAAIGAVTTHVGNLGTLTTTATGNLVAAINEVKAASDGTTAGLGTLQTRVGGVITVGGALAANVVSSSNVTNGSLTGTDIQDASIGGTKLADATIVAGKYGIRSIALSDLGGAGLLGDTLLPDPYHRHVAPTSFYADREGRTRWISPTVLTLITNDPSNPYVGGRTLRHTNVIGFAGRVLYLDEAGIKAGMILSFAMEAAAASGTFALQIVGKDASGSTVASSTSTSATKTGDGTVQVATVVNYTVQATTVALWITSQRQSGTAAIDIYRLTVNHGTDAAANPQPGVIPADTMLPNENLCFDPQNIYGMPGVEPGLRPIWYRPDQWTKEIDDATNPSPFVGGRTLYFPAGSTSGAGKQIWCAPNGIIAGSGVEYTVVAHMLSNGGIWILQAEWFNKEHQTVGGPYTNASPYYFLGANQLQRISVPQAPATAAYLRVSFVRSSGAGWLRVYHMGVYKGRSLGNAPMASNFDPMVWLGSRMPDTFNRSMLRSWVAKVAHLIGGDATARPTLLMMGDSWIARHGIATRLRTLIQAAHGNGGMGWISFTVAGSAYAGSIWTLSHTGAWTDVDSVPGSPVGHGLDLMHVISSTVTSRKTLVVTTQNLKLFYENVTTGGSFKWRVDGGAWSSDVSTAGSGLGTVSITGLTNASHTFDVEVTVAGSGVTILGSWAYSSGAGAIVATVGNGGIQASQYTEAPAIWDAQLAAIAPDAASMLIGTNDRSALLDPTAFELNLEAWATRVRTTLPYSDLAFIAPADNQQPTSTDGSQGTALQYKRHSTWDFSQAHAQAAVNKNAAFLSLSDIVGPWIVDPGDATAIVDPRGIYETVAFPVLHFNSYGEVLAANALYNRLFQVV